MPLHQKLLTALLLVLTGMLMGVLLMIMRGSWIPPEQVQVRFTDVIRSSEPVHTTPEMDIYSPSNVFSDIAERVIPAVVYIETEIPLQQVAPDEQHHYENPLWDRFLPRRRAQSIGSGVLISGDGYILTNHHVIEGAENRIRVHTYDRIEYPAKLVGSDPSTDLAVIKIDKRDARSIVIGNSDHVKIGDWVMAVGNPFRLRSTVTAGIVSAMGRDVDIISDRMRIESFIQTDAAINRGNSGGALVNTFGELIGINTAIASESGVYQGYGFAVPVNLAIKISQDMIEYGSVQRAFLGVEISSVDYEQARRYGLEKVGGVEIRSLVPQGSADMGGLKKGDVILAVNDYPVDAANRLQERIALMRPGERVTLSIWRNKKAMDLHFPLMGMDNEVIREWASSAPLPPERLEFEPDPDSAVPQKTFEAGFTVAELVLLEEPTRKELVVIRVVPGSPAETAGMKEEDVITHFGNQPVGTLGALASAWNRHDKNREIKIQILRSIHQQTLTIEPY